MCILVTNILQKKAFKYYFLKKNLVNYQTIAQIFKKKLNIDRCMERPNVTFCNGKNKKNNELDNKLIENNHEECSYLQKIQFII